tara:strand:- start:227 stop:538 length:312 start_codon:yes stop_codon:yes gene_type:complete
MKQFKITVGDKSQITTTGVELYTTILKKFGVEYTIEEINQPNQKSLFDNDIPHSDVRRMESEGVYEEKFSEENSSTTNMGNWCHPTVTEDVSVKYVYEPNKPL